MRWYVMICWLALFTLVPGGGLLYAASSQDGSPDQEWGAPPSADNPDSAYPDEDPGEYDPQGVAPDDGSMDEGYPDEAPADPGWQDEEPPSQE